MKVFKMKNRDLPPRVRVWIDWDCWCVEVDPYTTLYGAMTKEELKSKLKSYEHK